MQGWGHGYAFDGQGVGLGMPSFEQLDTDKNGCITLDEYAFALRLKKRISGASSLQFTSNSSESSSSVPGTTTSAKHAQFAEHSSYVPDDKLQIGAQARRRLSPNYPADYNTNDNCEVSIDGEGVLHSLSFDIEQNYDNFFVGSTIYTGPEGPNGHEVNSSVVLRFSSDSSITKSGFEVCVTSTSPSPPSSHPLLTVISGLCQTSSEGTCLQSPNYPADYNTNDNCEVSIDGEGVLHSLSFDTEQNYDNFFVGSTIYTGPEGPNGHEVNSSVVLRFSSDSSITKSGFEVCVTSSAPRPNIGEGHIYCLMIRAACNSAMMVDFTILKAHDKRLPSIMGNRGCWLVDEV
ncbi:hypothetical protein CYMTET_5744 [Cymbomonas tetramitiformis]|uniref:EF-hand domain-containing protein n=1 Tax=Cymbomonas tetramitiformis TaxID=36881 RepID=A0AAE0LJ59_9CHLO|nr:hypothetical protein CYMTET_5744 [Cymbomonas tetramitiformis]